MKLLHAFAFLLAATLSAASCTTASATLFADATLEVTYTLTGVTITDTVSGATTPAVFETTNELGDLIFEDIGPNSNTFAGGAVVNPPGSIGSASASEDVSLNGLDPFVDDYDQDSFGIGDSLVLTMNVAASAETPGSIFFGQVDSDVALFFSTFSNDTDSYTFSFDYSAVLTGTLNNSTMPGVTLGFSGNDEVIGLAEDTLAGPPNSFLALDSHVSLGQGNIGNGVVLIDDMASGSFDVAFDAGDNTLSIQFLTTVFVNADVDEIPEPASLGLMVLCAAGWVGAARLFC